MFLISWSLNSLYMEALPLSHFFTTIMHLILIFVGTESVGSGTSTFQEFDDDGFHDVDGWKHSSFI